MEDRIKTIEAKLCAVSHFLLWVGLISFFNFGVSLWFFQRSKDVDWNFIAVTLTIFEVFLVIALASGFWMLRGAAQAAAAEEAHRVVPPIAEKVARQTAIQYAALAGQANAQEDDSQDLKSMVESLGDEDGTTA